MTTMTTLASNVSQILASIGLGHVGVHHDDEITWVTDTILPAADARRAVEALRAAGYVADDARDDHAAGSWVYVSPDVVEVRAYVDAAGDLMVELPDLRGCVEVREATREESDESAGTTEGWITTHVARHLLVAVGYLQAGGGDAVSAAIKDGWTDLPCGGRVLVQQGRPVRVSDEGRDDVTDAQIGRDLNAMGWTVSVGEWSVGDERDATVEVWPNTTTYSWSTDAASGELQATSVEEAVEELVLRDKWASLDSPREQRDIADGAWLLLHDADGCIVLRRGVV